tara:strand:- start:426 stop:683 length:258 start_codon:yes stop_codon:yes gene_type:complete
LSKDIRFIHQDCDPSMADDKTLPYSAYLVEYLQDGVTKFDIVSAAKKVDIFDHYWDNYRHDFKNMTQTEGRINPKMWGNSEKKKK